MSNNEKHTENGIYMRWKNALALAMPDKTFKQRMIYPALAAFFALLGFIFTAKTIPVGVSALGAPFADALLCSSGIYTPFVYIGALMGSIHFGKMSIARALTLTLLFVLRIITGSKQTASNPQSGFFAENIVTRVAVCSLFCFAQCGMYLAAAGINGESAKAVLATLIATPFLTFAFSVYYSKNAEGKLNRFLHEISMLFLFSCIIYSASGINYAFITLDTMFCVFFVLCIAKFGGFSRAVLYGFVLGYITSPQYFVCFLILGAAASLLFSLGTFGACGISCSAACISAIFIGGAKAFMGVIPETVIACAIATPIIRYAFLPKNFPYPLNDAAYADSFSDNMRCALAELSFIRSLRRASDNLRAVSGGVKEVTEPFKEARVDSKSAIEQVHNEFCEKCPLSTICHDSEKERCQMALVDLIELCKRDEPLVMENIPLYLSSHCIRLRELTDYVKQMDKGEPSVAPVTEILPKLSYDSVSDIISSIYNTAEKELVFDASAETAVSRLLYAVGVPFGGVSVVGKSEKKVFIYGSDKRKLKKAEEEFKKGLNRIFGCDYCISDTLTEEHSPIIFSPCERLKTESAVSLLCKKGESVSGDTVISFSDGSGKFYALISDGMGSGKAACKSSSVTAELIRNFMLAGIDEVLAVRLAGEALLPMCDECFSTVDLMKIDLTTGNACMVKNHAAASYILRAGSVYCCSSSSLPIGINSVAVPERTELKLSDGDTVIMVSDGISSESLPDIIGLSADLSPRELAERIMAKSVSANDSDDDKSVMVIRISKAA